MRVKCDSQKYNDNKYDLMSFLCISSVIVGILGFFIAIFYWFGMIMLIISYCLFSLTLFVMPNVNKQYKVFVCIISLCLGIWFWHISTFKVSDDVFYSDGWQAIIELYNNKLTCHDLSVIYIIAKKTNVEPYRIIKTIVYSDASVPDYNPKRLARVRSVKQYFNFHLITGLRLSVFITSNQYDKWEEKNYPMLIVSSSWQ